MAQSTIKERTRGHFTAKTHKSTWHYPYIFVLVKGPKPVAYTMICWGAPLMTGTYTNNAMKQDYNKTWHLTWKSPVATVGRMIGPWCIGIQKPHALVYRGQKPLNP